MKIKLLAYGKVNLYLRVFGKRKDGYHEIESIIQNISLADEIELAPSKETKFWCNLPFLVRKDNLVLKASQSLQKKFNIPCISIKLIKKIPISAGLGGGSADAAAVLVGLRYLFDLNLVDEELIEIGSEIGSDIPFFIKGGTCLVKGKGENVSSLSPLPECWIILFKPPFQALTKEIYEKFDEKKERVSKKSSSIILKGLERKNLKEVAQGLENDLEEVTGRIYPLIFKIKKEALTWGALGSLMSGSGPAVFSLVDLKKKALKVNTKLKLMAQKTSSEVYLTFPVRRGVEFGEQTGLYSISEN